jgi:hypothetical protein
MMRHCAVQAGDSEGHRTSCSYDKLVLQAVVSLTLANGALDVPHDEPVLVVQELHADLGDLYSNGRG